jgi:hypothetical protein
MPPPRRSRRSRATRVRWAERNGRRARARPEPNRMPLRRSDGSGRRPGAEVRPAARSAAGGVLVAPREPGPGRLERRGDRSAGRPWPGRPLADADDSRPVAMAVRALDGVHASTRSSSASTPSRHSRSPSTSMPPRHGAGRGADDSRLHGAVPAVDFEAHRGLERRVRDPPEARFRRRSARHASGAPPAASVKATWRPSPMGCGSARWAAGTSSDTADCRSRTAPGARAPRRAACRGGFPDDRVDPLRRDEVLGTQDGGGVGGEGRAEVVDPVALDRQARGARWPPCRRRCSPPRRSRRAGRRPGWSGPSRCPFRRRARSARRAVMALGDARGHDADDARMPVLPRQDVGGGARAAPRTCASASKRIRSSRCFRSALHASSSAATAALGRDRP